MSKCSHAYDPVWVDTSWTDDYGHHHSEGHWQTKSAQEDIDLHRFKCKRCGEIGYYSGAARAYHEDGVKTDIPGLGG